MLQFYTKDQVDEIAALIGAELYKNKMTPSVDTKSFIKALDSVLIEKTTPVNLSLITNYGSPGLWDLNVPIEEIELEVGRNKITEGSFKVFEHISQKSSVDIRPEDFKASWLPDSIELEGYEEASPPLVTGRLTVVFNKDNFTPVTREIDLTSITNRGEQGSWETSVYAPSGTIDEWSYWQIANNLIESMNFEGLDVSQYTLKIVEGPSDVEAPVGYAVKSFIPEAPGFGDISNTKYRFTGSLLVYVKLKDYETYDLKNTNFSYNNNYIQVEDGKATVVVKDSTKTPETIAEELIASLIAQAYSSYNISSSDLIYTITSEGVIEIKGTPESDQDIVKGRLELVLDIVIEKEPLINLSNVSNVDSPGVWEIPYPGLVNEDFDHDVVVSETINEIASSLGIVEPVSFDLKMRGRGIYNQWNRIEISHYNLRGDEDVVGNLTIEFAGAEPYPTEVDLDTLSNIGEPGIWFVDKDTIKGENLMYEGPTKILEVLSEIFEGTSWTPTFDNTTVDRTEGYFTVRETPSYTKRPGKLKGILTGYYLSKVDGEFEPLKGKVDLNTLIPEGGGDLQVGLPYPEYVTMEQLLEALTHQINEVALDPVSPDQLTGYFVNKPSARVSGVPGLLGAGIKNSIMVRAVSDGTEAPRVDLSTSGSDGGTNRDYFVENLQGWESNIDQIIIDVLAEINAYKGSDLTPEDVSYEVYGDYIYLEKAPGSKRVIGITYISIKEFPSD